MTLKDGMNFGTGLLVVYLAYKIIDGTVNNICRYAGVDTKLKTWVKSTADKSTNVKSTSRNTIGFKY